MFFKKVKKAGLSINPATENDAQAVRDAVKAMSDKGFDARLQVVQGNTMGYVFYEVPQEEDVKAAVAELTGITTENISGSWLKMVEKVTRA